jgi:hypothetical protein
MCFLERIDVFAEQAASMMGDAMYFSAGELGVEPLYVTNARYMCDVEFMPWNDSTVWLAGCWTRAFDLCLRMLRIGRERATTVATEAHFSKWDKMLRAWMISRKPHVWSGMTDCDQNSVRRISLDGVGHGYDVPTVAKWLDAIELPDV